MPDKNSNEERSNEERYKTGFFSILFEVVKEMPVQDLVKTVLCLITIAYLQDKVPAVEKSLSDNLQSPTSGPGMRR